MTESLPPEDPRDALIRELRDIYQFEPGKQNWAEQIAGLLIHARDARADEKNALDPDIAMG